MPCIIIIIKPFFFVAILVVGSFLQTTSGRNFPVNSKDYNLSKNEKLEISIIAAGSRGLEEAEVGAVNGGWIGASNESGSWAGAGSATATSNETGSPAAAASESGAGSATATATRAGCPSTTGNENGTSNNGTESESGGTRNGDGNN